MTAQLLEVEGLTTEFESSRRGRVTSLAEIDIALAEGEILGVVGESGAGKSVLLRTILGVLHPNERIAAGTIRFHGEPLPISEDDAMQERRGATISLIESGQRARLDPVRRIGDQLLDVMNAHDRVVRERRHERAEELLRLVGIPDAQHQLRSYPHELSGGMCQRVVIALALANSPELLMADEPTAGLDVTIQTQILDLFRSLVRETGAASILATRDLAQVAHYCDRVVVLRAGRIVDQAPVRRFFARPATDYGAFLLRAAHAARGEEIARAESPTAPARRDRARPAADAEPLLDVRGLVKHYRTQRHVVHAVNGISFSLRPGETLALVGESGSGKTTVGRCIAGLIRPTEGEIRLLGRDVGHVSTRRRSQQAGLETQVVFQEPRESLNPRWKLGASVEEPLRHQKQLDRRQRARRVLELLELVGLGGELADSYPHQTSAGVQQRVAIARAIAVNPKLVVLDEPTSALDMSVKAQVIDLLIRLQDRLGLSYLFISHDMTAVRMIAHRIAIMYLGRIMLHGPADDVFAQQTNPYGRALLSSVLYPDPEQERSLFRLEGEIPSAIELPPGCPLATRCPLAQPRCNDAPPPLEPVAGFAQLSACVRNSEIVQAGGPDALARREGRLPERDEPVAAG
ncbi:MAG TPA: ABC transporter ATP-binding protein [Gaiellaceae bacterium]|nr:ABC transporter ATP-binding protein [Gaiellaceae bacterium]